MKRITILNFPIVLSFNSMMLTLGHGTTPGRAPGVLLPVFSWSKSFPCCLGVFSCFALYFPSFFLCVVFSGHLGERPMGSELSDSSHHRAVCEGEEEED